MSSNRITYDEVNTVYQEWLLGFNPRIAESFNHAFLKSILYYGMLNERSGRISQELENQESVQHSQDTPLTDRNEFEVEHNGKKIMVVFATVCACIERAKNQRSPVPPRLNNDAALELEQETEKELQV